MIDEDYRYILRRIDEIIIYIQGNWSDNLAEEYLIYLQNIEREIKVFEKKRLEIESRKMEIEKYCQDIVDGSEDQPKVRRRQR